MLGLSVRHYPAGPACSTSAGHNLKDRLRTGNDGKVTATHRTPPQQLVHLLVISHAVMHYTRRQRSSFDFRVTVSFVDAVSLLLILPI